MATLQVIRGVTTILHTIILMWWYKNFSLGAFTFLGIIGSYELVRMSTSMAFNLSPKSKYLSALYLPSDLFFIPAIIAWVMTYVMISDYSKRAIAPERLFWACLIFIVGLTLLMISETQKVVYAQHKKYVNTTGIFELVRNPEFFALFLVTAGIAVLVGSALCWGLIILLDVPVAIIAILRKERALEKEEEWKAYSQRTWSVLPRIFSSKVLSILSWAALISVAVVIYRNNGLVKILTVKK